MNKFTFNLSLILAHSIVYFTKEDLSPNGIVDDISNGPGAPPVVTSGQSMEQIMQQITQNLPQYTAATNAAVLPTQQAQLAASQQVSPAYQDLANSLNQSAGVSAAQTGAQEAKIAQSATQDLDPSFYTARTEGSSGYTDLLNELNPTNTNPSATRDVLNTSQATGNTGNSSATNSVSNALQYGNENLARSQAFGNALQGLSGFMSGSYAPSGSQAAQVTPTVNTQNSGVQTTAVPAQQAANSLLGANTNVEMQQNQLLQSRLTSNDAANNLASIVGASW